MVESVDEKEVTQLLKIIAHHVGARGFGVSLNLPATFGPEVTHVLYEADADAVKRMESELDSAHAKMLSEKYVLPYCLGSKRGRATLNVTRNSYASSLFPPNEGFLKYYCEIPIDRATYDIPYIHMLEVVRQVQVEVYALDDLLGSGSVPIARAPDFLSLDAQGYELEILRGAKKALATGVLGIVSEVEMIPMYSGQPLLGDILNFAAANDFLFAGFTAQYDVSPYRGPLGTRGKAFPGFGDALFLRDINKLSEDNFATDSLYVMLRKLSFIAISFGFIEYASAAAKAAERIRNRVSPSLLVQANRFKYCTFLDEIQKALDQHEALFPPVHAVPDDSRPDSDPFTSWYNKYHQAALLRYNECMGQSATFPPDAKVENNPTLATYTPLSLEQRLKRSELAMSLYQLLPKRFARRLRRWLFPEPFVAAPISKPDLGEVAIPSPASAMPCVERYTPLEKVLDDWGFAGPAYIVRQRRLSAEPFVRSLSPEMKADANAAHIGK